MSRIKKSLRLIIVLAPLILAGCASSPYEPEKYYLVIASKEDILDAAYEAMLEVYPYTLFFPLMSQQPGYYWRLDYWDRDPYYDPGINDQFEFRLEKSLGFTPEGSIITGYRYTIVSYGLGYVNDFSELHHLDLVFRSELFKRRIERIEVEEVL